MFQHITITERRVTHVVDTGRFTWNNLWRQTIQIMWNKRWKECDYNVMHNPKAPPSFSQLMVMQKFIISQLQPLRKKCGRSVEDVCSYIQYINIYTVKSNFSGKKLLVSHKQQRITFCRLPGSVANSHIQSLCLLEPQMRGPATRK